METKPSRKAENSEKGSTQKEKMCESKMCTEKATGLESYKGQLYELCKGHLRLIRKQKKLDNNQ